MNLWPVAKERRRQSTDNIWARIRFEGFSNDVSIT